MGGAMVFALTIEIGAAVLVTWLTWRAANGTLARNSFAGIRTRITMSSDSAWRIGHRAALRPTIIAGAITVVWCSACIGLSPLRTPLSVIVASMVLLGGALLSVPVAHQAVRRGALGGELAVGLERPIAAPIEGAPSHSERFAAKRQAGGR